MPLSEAVIDEYSRTLKRHPSPTLTKKPPQAGREPTVLITYFAYSPFGETNYESTNRRIAATHACDEIPKLYAGDALIYNGLNWPSTCVCDLDAAAIESTIEDIQSAILVDNETCTIGDILVCDQDRGAGNVVACELPQWIAKKLKTLPALPVPGEDDE